MKKVAITGGSGFIGSAISRECLKRGYEVYLFDKTRPVQNLPENIKWVQCDVADKELVEKVMDDVKPDHLYLVAGVLGTSELNEIPSIASTINVVGLANFMDLVVKYKKEGRNFPRVFYVTKPNVWNNMYTITKEASEKIIQFYMDEYGLKGVIHKWYNVYGPGQHTHPIRKAVPYFILMTLNNKPLKIHGDGNQTMDLVYVDDVAKIAVEAMNKPEEEITNSEVIDVGSGKEVSVNFLAESIRKLCNSNSKIVRESMRSGEIPGTKLAADIGRLNEFMPDDFMFTDYEEGMKKTIEYYKNLNPIQVQAALEFYDRTT